jgi:hypothetical protein
MIRHLTRLVPVPVWFGYLMALATFLNAYSFARSLLTL